MNDLYHQYFETTAHAGLEFGPSHSRRYKETGHQKAGPNLVTIGRKSRFSKSMAVNQRKTHFQPMIPAS